MPEVEIYHAKFGHSDFKNKEVMTVLVIWGGRQAANRETGLTGKVKGGNYG